MQNLRQQKLYRLAVQTNKNDLQDFFLNTKFACRSERKNFLRINVPLAHFGFVSAEGTIILGVLEYVNRKILQNHSQIYEILVLSGTTFKVIDLKMK